jgi:hypothetical protein
MTSQLGDYMNEQIIQIGSREKIKIIKNSMRAQMRFTAN